MKRVKIVNPSRLTKRRIRGVLEIFENEGGNWQVRMTSPGNHKKLMLVEGNGYSDRHEAEDFACGLAAVHGFDVYVVE